MGCVKVCRRHITTESYQPSYITELYKNVERGLNRANKSKSVYPQLQSPAPDHTPGTGRATGDSIKAGAFRFER